MQQFLKIALMFAICFVAVNLTTVDDAHALKVYKKTSDLIGTPTKKNGVVVTTVSPTALSVRHAKYLTQGFNGKIVDVALVKSKTRITGFAYNCPGYYTTRIYSDKAGRNMIGYIQVYVAQGDIANHSKCAKVTPPKSSKPKPAPTPDNKYPEPEPDPEPDPPAPKKIHPNPKVEVKITQKPAAKPTPTKPKPEPPKPPAPPPTPPPAPPSEEELVNAICKRASVYGGYDSGYSPNTDAAHYPSNYNRPIDPYGGNGQYYVNQLKPDGSKYNASDNYYALKANNDGDYNCCPVGAGLSNIMTYNGNYTCVKATAAQVQASYCVLNPAGTIYNAETDQCEIEDIKYDGDPEGWPLKLDEYEAEEGDDKGFGERSYDAEIYDNANEEGDLGGDTGGGGCELCEVFKCPGFEEIVLPGFKEIGEQLIGDVEPPPVPDIPLPPMPNIFDVLEDVDERNPTKPTGDDGFGDEDGFSADDVKQQAPDLPVQADETGGFDIVDPLTTLPDDGSDAPRPTQEEIEKDIPYPDSERTNAIEIDIETQADKGVPTPQDTTVDDTAAYPVPGTDNISPPSYDGNATPPAYEDSVAYPGF